MPIIIEYHLNSNERRSFSKVIWMIFAVNIIFCSCSSNEVIVFPSSAEKLETDTVINGWHIQVKGKVPTVNDYMVLFKGFKMIVDTLSTIGPADKDTIMGKYKKALGIY